MVRQDMTKPSGFPGVLFELFVLGQTWIFESLRQMMNNPAMMQQVPVSEAMLCYQTIMIF